MAMGRMSQAGTEADAATDAPPAAAAGRGVDRRTRCMTRAEQRHGEAHYMSVLEDIVAGVREDLAEREARVPLDALKERAAAVPGALECRGRLRQADALSVIAEVK